MSETQHIVCPHCTAVNRISSSRIDEQPKCGKCHKPLFLGKAIDLNRANFDKHIARSDIPVVVDFWASWCGPCKMMAPAFQQAADTLEPKVRFAKLNTETEQAIAARYRIQSIPTMIMFKNGKEAKRQSGAMGARDIINWLNVA